VFSLSEAVQNPESFKTESLQCLLGQTPLLALEKYHVSITAKKICAQRYVGCHSYEIGGHGRRWIEVPCAEAMDPLSQSPRTAAQGSDDVVEALVPTSHLQRQHPDSAHPLPADTATEHRRRFGFLRVFGSHR
jgi:hypothetical protein